MVAKNDEPTIAQVTPALIRAAVGFRYTETVTRTMKCGDRVMEEITEVHERYYPPDPEAARTLFDIGRQALGKDFLQ